MAEKSEKNKQKLEDFLLNLEKNAGIQEMADFYKTTNKEIVRKSKPYSIVKRDKTGEIKSIKVDFEEKESGIKVKQSVEY